VTDGHEVSRLLAEWAKGNSNALEKLTPLVIHANAQAEWDFGEGRKVVDEYRTDFGTVALTSKQFTEAVQNCIGQVIWYDEQISPERT
jgi:hypothetical protein